MKKLIGRILEDFSILEDVNASEVDDFQNPIHIVRLKEVMASYGIQDEVINPIIRTLTEEDDEGGLSDKEKEKVKKLKLVSLGYGNYGKEKGGETTHKTVDGKLVAIGDEQPEKDDSGNLEPDDLDPVKTNYMGIGKDDETDIDKEASDDGITGNPEEGDNQVKNDMFKYGYGKFQKNTGTKPAPGGAGSAFNEIMSGEGVHMLKENSNMSEQELAMKMYEKVKNTELGKEQKGTLGIGKKDMPDGFDGNENLFSKCIISARSAKKKYERTQKRIKRLQEQNKFGEPQKTLTFYGAQSSIDAQVKMVENANTILTPKGKVIKKEDAVAFIKAGGGGINPSDTATFVQDKDGNLLIQFHSDKTTTNDIQDNSTLIKEGENYKEYLKEEDLTDDERQQANDLVDEYSEKIKKIEENYNRQAIPIAQKLTELPIENQVKIIEEDKGTLKKNLDVAIFGKAAYDNDNFEKVSGKYNEYLPEGVNPKNLTTEQKLEMVQKLVSDEKGVGTDTKLINKLSEALLRENPTIQGLNVKKNLSDQREKVVRLQRERLNKLNEIKSGLGISMEANEAERAFHLKMMDYPPKEYEEGNPESLMGDCLDVNMGGNIVNGEVLQNCLGVENTKDFKEKFRVVEEDDLIFVPGTDIVTGKNVFTYAIDTETGKRIDIGYKTYRSKDGAAGKTNNTMTYSKGMQNCFKTGEKP
tara:strand:- start:1193 stop:3286 length:2094 start_codon:yes stop_codon:yes gene_type:complete